MAVARITTAEGTVLGGTPVTIEADLSRGLHSFTIVGLAGKAVEEAKDRVSSAIKNSGYPSPKSTNHKIVISLAPADIKKNGPLYDLPIALAYLLAAELIEADTTGYAFVGELALDGTMRPVRGMLAIVEGLRNTDITHIVVPKENAREAALIDDLTVLPAGSLTEVIDAINTMGGRVPSTLSPQPRTELRGHWYESAVALEDIRGQESAKRALQIAAAGRHNVLLVGPPGTGKTMLARALQSLLPPLSNEAALEVLRIHSVSGQPITFDMVAPPFRAPHHTASHTSLVGGGVNPRPGEVTLAHHGVLFMDEFPEFERRSLDALRQPLEDRVVNVSRVSGSATFPADFLLVAAMNPYRGSEDGTIDYVAAMHEAYQHKISGPILDRIDLWVDVPHIDYDTLTEKRTVVGNAETKAAQEAIAAARAKAEARGVSANAHLSARHIDEHILLKDDVATLLKDASQRLNLSPRSYHRVIKVARTIADLTESNDITTSHLLEALQYRVKM